MTGDDKYIISGSADKTIAVWDIANKTLLHRFQEAHSGWISSVVVTGDDKYIISGSYDKTIAVWDIANKTYSASPLPRSTLFTTGILLMVHTLT